MLALEGSSEMSVKIWIAFSQTDSCMPDGGDGDGGDGGGDANQQVITILVIMHL